MGVQLTMNEESEVFRRRPFGTFPNRKLRSASKVSRNHSGLIHREAQISLRAHCVTGPIQKTLLGICNRGQRNILTGIKAIGPGVHENVAGAMDDNSQGKLARAQCAEE